MNKLFEAPTFGRGVSLEIDTSSVVMTDSELESAGFDAVGA